MTTYTHMHHAARFEREAELARDQGSETGRTMAISREVVLWVEMPDEAADALLDRMCK